MSKLLCVVFICRLGLNHDTLLQTDFKYERQKSQYLKPHHEQAVIMFHIFFTEQIKE